LHLDPGQGQKIVGNHRAPDIPLAVSRVAPDDHAVEDQGGGAASEKDLVALLGLTPTLDDDVGVVLKEGDHLL